MKYVSIDLETTGLDPEICQILQIGAVIADDEHPEVQLDDLPSYDMIVKHDIIQGEPYALMMNAKIIELIAKPQDIFKYILSRNISSDFLKWCRAYIPDGKIALAGKNVANFDLRFLRKLICWEESEFHHRVIDPATYYRLPSDKQPPDMKLCSERAVIDMSNFTMHTALSDAKLVVELLRRGPQFVKSKV